MKLVHLGNVECPFIAITSKSILAVSGGVCKDPIYRSNRTVQSFTQGYYFHLIELSVLNCNTWNLLTAMQTND